MHEQRLEPVIGMVRERDVRGTRLAGRIEKRRMPQRARIIGESPAPALRMDVTPDERDAKLARERLHVSGIGIRIGTQVVVHMHRDDTSARRSPSRDRRARRQQHAGIRTS